ncbi:MAG TPA: DUF5050 domain-containing protein [Candidatus Dormibacteraeota bacterium]
MFDALRPIARRTVRLHFTFASRARAPRLLVATAFACALGVLFPAGAAAAKSPALAFSPSAYDYGTALTGHAVSQTFTLRNSGGTGSAVLTVGLSGSPAFRIISDSCTGTSLGPGMTCSVRVQFTAGIGAVSATLTAHGKKSAAAATDSLSATGVARQLYWTNRGDGTIVEANLDGSNPATIVTGQNAPQGVAVNASHMYWANDDGSIVEANLDGSNPATIVPQSSFAPAGLALDGSHLYWADFNSGTIVEANLDGSNPTVIASGQNSPVGVAVDSTHLYWANVGDGTIVEASLDGTNPTTIVSGLDGPAGLALDSSHLYWADLVDGTIVEANLDGSNPTVIATGLPFPVGVAVDSSNVYWADENDGTVMQSNLDGSSPTVIANSQNAPYGVAVSPQ